MSGQFHLDTSDAVLSEPAAMVAVYRYDPTGMDDDSRYQLMPNLVCEHVQRSLGAKPSTAQLRYVLDSSGLYPQWPVQFEDIWPQTAAPSSYVLSVDDRVVVFAWTADGQRHCLFDGFAQIPQVNVSPQGQTVTVVCSGVEIRCWDTPIGGRTQRDIDNPTTGDMFNVDLPCRFNPSHGKDGVIPNCTKPEHDVNVGTSTAYPVFLDEHVKYSPDPDSDKPDPRVRWTVSGVVRYILQTQNGDETYVKNPDSQDLINGLSIRTYSFDDNQNLVWSDNDTQTDNAPVRDYDCNNKAWPEAIEHILRTVDFGCFFALVDSDSGPQTSLQVYKIDDYSITKSVGLDVFGSGLDPSISNLSSVALARDVNQIANAWTIETSLVRWEVSIVLAPGFTPALGDVSSASTFLLSKLAQATATVREKYRRYVADEIGDGHWDVTESAFITTSPIDLSPIFPDNPPSDDEGSPQRTYVRRARRGSMTLNTLDQNGKPRRAVLHYSKNYTGSSPAVWDGETGTWNKVADGAWKLLDDCLGIEFICENPDAIATGKGNNPIRGIKWIADPPTGVTLTFMLTTVIDDDFMIPAVLPARISSPTKFVRRRRHDAKDHYQKREILAYSFYDPEGDGTNTTTRDDTLTAINLAAQYRAAREMPPLAGSLTIPHFTDYYYLTDRIKSIYGRNVDLRANTAPDQDDGQPPMYPMVVDISYNFSGSQQQTVLHLSDTRAEPRG